MLTKDPLRYDRLFELERFAEAVRVLCEHAEVVHLVLGQVGDAVGGDVGAARARLRPEAAVRFALFDHVSLDGRAPIVGRRLPVDGEHVARDAHYADRAFGGTRLACRTHARDVL